MFDLCAICFSVGPFLTAVLNRLESMRQHTLYVNLLLTDLVARLACYPQPLLSSLILSPSLVFQPSVKSLMQVRCGEMFRLSPLPLDLSHLVDYFRVCLICDTEIYCLDFLDRMHIKTTCGSNCEWCI